MLRSLAVVCLLAAPAVAGHGARSALHVDATSPSTSVSGVEISARGDRTTARFTVSTSRTNQDAWVVFDVPTGAEVSYLALTVDGQHRIARATDAITATTTYTNIVAGTEDPAVLEDAGDGRLRLRVFPLGRGKPVRVELIMAPVGERAVDHVDRETSLFIGQPPLPELPPEPPRPVTRRGAFRISEECLRNAIAPSCM